MTMISVVVPILNESANIERVYIAVRSILHASDYEWEILFVNDGSTDTSGDILARLSAGDPRVRHIEFSRNFGKEIALTAGLHASKGDAALMMDADLQHPPEYIPEFLAQWKAGNEVVVGIRSRSVSDNHVKRIGSRVFYWFMNLVGETKTMANATDFRLLDRIVIDAFVEFTERQRITRALIDWLGFKRSFVYFDAPGRIAGSAQYSIPKLMRLALHSLVSMSLFPLRLAGYLGIVIVAMAGCIGLFILVEQFMLGDPLSLNVTWPAILAIINLFLVGVTLSCLGLIALYIAHIHREVVNRPLYIVRKRHS